MSPARSLSPVGSPRSNLSYSKSPKSYNYDGNSMDSNLSASRSPTRQGPRSPSSAANSNERHKSYESDRSPDGRLSPKDKSPVSSRSSIKSPSSARHSPKSPRSGPASPGEDYQGSPKRSSELDRGNFNELDGEQISDGDIDDEPEQAITNSKPVPMSHGEDLSDVSDLDSMDGVDEGERENGEREVGQERAIEVRESPKKIEVKKPIEDKIATVSLADENEQLDFEADGQWRDERDDGKFFFFLT